MIALRIRCQVLKVIAGMDDGTAEQVGLHLPDLTAKQVQKALYNLCTDDEIRKIGEQPRGQANGKPWNVYQCRDENTPIDISKKKYYKKSGRKDIKQELQSSAKWDMDKNRMIVKYRERKLHLLNRLMTHVSGTDTDLLIGIIKDYE